MLEIIFFVFLGILAGTISGLIPGVHINLISSLLVSFSNSSIFSSVALISLISFIVSMSITHTYIDFIPSILLGAPDEDTILAILPGHQMLIEGKGYQAIIFSAIGALTAILSITLISPLFIFFLKTIYPYAQNIILIILLLTSSLLIISETKSKSLALVIFLISGILGFSSMNLGIKEPLLPLFTGLFGTSSLLTSILKKQKIPEQKIFPLKEILPNKKEISLPLTSSLLISPFMSFLPGLGSGQASTICSQISPKINQKQFLIMLGAVNIITLYLSFIAVYAINKTRTGAAVAISQISSLSLPNLSIILIIALITGVLCFPLTILIAKLGVKIINKINYLLLSIIVLIFLIFIVIYFSGAYGFLILLVSTSFGFFTIQLGIKRIHLMGCLLVPTILFYLL